MVLKKSDVLLGIDDPRLVMIDSLGGELYLRPLSSAEINKIVSIEAKGYGQFEASNNNRQTLTKGNMDLAKMNDATAKAQYEAIHLSINNDLNEDDWKIEEIRRLPTNVIKELYENIMQISGAETTESDVKNFPEE